MVREIHPNAAVICKNNCVLDFWSYLLIFSKKSLRKTILENLKQFILEFGKGFKFVSNTELKMP